MHCWLRKDISTWIHIFIFMAMLSDTLVSNSLPTLNTTTPRSDNTNVYKAEPKENYTIEHSTYTNETETVSTSTYIPEINNVSDFSNHTNVSQTTVTYNTTGADGTGDTSHPSLNLAIIPAVAVLVFLIIFCIRCCKWFRSYTRGEDKDEGSQYAAICQIGDEDYGQVEILSDSSTAYNDTVSSYCSFLKRSGNDCTLTPIKSLKNNNIKLNSPNKEYSRKALKMPDSIKTERKVMMHDTSRKSPRNQISGSVISDSILDERIRNLSESSEENDRSSISFSELGDSQQGRKMQRSKVSFSDTDRKKHDQIALSPFKRSTNTSTSEFSPRLDERPMLRSSLKRGQMRLPGQSKYHSANFRPCFSEASTPVEDAVFCVQIKQETSGNGCANSNGSPKKVSVAVQTDKSFRYSMWKRRHFSDPGHEEPSVFETVSETATTCSCPHERVAGQRDGVVLLVSCHGKSNSIDKKLGDNTNENDIDSNNVCNSGSNDDVFVTCNTPPISCKTYPKALDNDIDSNDNRGKNNEHTTPNNRSEDKKCNSDNRGVSVCLGSCHLSRPLMLKDLNHESGQDNQKVPICSICKESIISDEDRQSNLLVSNCDKIHVCDICHNKRTNKIQNGRVIQELDKENIDLIKSINLKHTDGKIIRKETTSEGDDMTLSLTSLESSGYAEISSESSN